jgi:3'-phosphoadenosine 5'-phosphosulfate sulfotransferase (PAPS reductase)/FAD synthetase
MKTKQWQLQQKQSLPLEIKILLTKQRIIEWYEKFNGNVYVSFSGGKDSTVLLSIVREIYPDVEGVFCDTGLEYPEIKTFVNCCENITTIKPKMNFKDVISKYGIPIISKETSEKIFKFKNYNLSEKFRNYLLNGDDRGKIGMIPKKWHYLLDKNIDVKIGSRCCDVMKKRPFTKYEKIAGKKPFIGSLACESRLRTQKYLQNGCNSFETKHQVSNPLSIWTEQDILQYIHINNLQIAKVYGDVYKDDNVYKLSGCKRTGCVFCLYGIHLEKGENRIQKLKKTHPELYDYCINKLNLKKALKLINVPYE